jgi:hypothetical protein
VDIRSQRKTKTIEALWAVVLDDGKQEGVVRRDTPYGTTPMVTDDETLATGVLLDAARERFPAGRISVVKFVRV